MWAHIWSNNMYKYGILLNGKLACVLLWVFLYTTRNYDVQLWLYRCLFYGLGGTNKPNSLSHAVCVYVCVCVECEDDDGELDKLSFFFLLFIHFDIHMLLVYFLFNMWNELIYFFVFKFFLFHVFIFCCQI